MSWSVLPVCLLEAGENGNPEIDITMGNLPVSDAARAFCPGSRMAIFLESL
jgi:hypothetical protein